MNQTVGVFNDHALLLPDRDSIKSEADRITAERSSMQRGGQHQASGLADILPFPYLALLRSYVEQGRILDAQNILSVAGDLIPQDSKIRKALAPPRVKKSEKRYVDRSEEFRWLKRNSSQYRGKWVALSGKHLVHQADSFKELVEHLDTLAMLNKPLIHHIN